MWTGHLVIRELAVSARAGVAALTALAALLRFSTLDRESLWFDEAVAAVDVLRPSFVDTIDALSRADPTPPLYYVLLWVWTQAFGTGEVGLRSLSALCGTLAVPVIYAAAAQLTSSRRAGVMAAGLVAANPLLVWYAQETRAYALLTPVVALSLLAFARALTRPEPRAVALWAGAAALAMLTHYFAVFIVAAEGLWLLAATRDRRAVFTAGAPLVVLGLALGLLARHQAPTAGIVWVGELSFELRLRELPVRLIAGPRMGGVREDALLLGTLVCALPFLAAIATGIRRRAGGRGHQPRLDAPADRPLRQSVVVGCSLAAAVVLVPFLLAVGGLLDVFFYRYLLPASLPLALALAAVAAKADNARARVTLVVGLCAVFVVLNVMNALTPSAQREDWRAAARQLGAPRGDRLVGVVPFFAREPLAFYGHRLAPAPRTPTRVAEVVIVGIVGVAPARRPPPPAAPPGFERVPGDEPDGLFYIRYRNTDGRLVSADELQAQIGLPATYGLDSPPPR